MSRSLKYDIPGIDFRVELTAAAERGFGELFGADLAKPLPLVLEIGFGRGEFLMHLAEASPETAFVGVEYSSKRVLKLARRIARSPLRNVRLIEATAEQVVSEALPPACISCCWVNFPDPWPKKRHFKRRLIQPAFVAALRERLVPGGLFRIATDHPGYAEWIDEVLSTSQGVENRYAPDRFRPEAPGRMPTAYELEWRALGRPLHFFEYARSDG